MALRAMPMLCLLSVSLGFTRSIAPLFVFSLLYGLTAAAYSTSWGGVIREMQRKHENTDANVVFGLLAMGRGVGSIISGPLSKTLIDESKSLHDAAVSAYGSEYGSIIIFSGCTAFSGGLAWFVRRTGFISTERRWKDPRIHAMMNMTWSQDLLLSSRSKFDTG